MKLYHLLAKEFSHDDYFEFTVCAKSHQEAFNTVKKYVKASKYSYEFDDDIANWKIEEVMMDKSKVIQDSILYG